MEKKKFDLEAYRKWCEEKGLEAGDAETLEQFKAETEKTSQEGEKEALKDKQIAIFNSMCDYCGEKRVKYDERAFDAMDEVIRETVKKFKELNFLKRLLGFLEGEMKKAKKEGKDD